MDVSHLRVKVDSEGIGDVSKKLGGLGTSAANAEAKVTRLTDSITKLIGAQGKLTGSQASATSAAQAQLGAFQQLQTTINGIAAHMNAIVGAAGRTGSALQTLTQQTNAASDGFRHGSRWGGVMISTLKAMATYTGAISMGKLAKSVVEAGDEWANMRAKLEVVTGSQHNANVALERTFKIAQDLRVPLASVNQLFARLYPAMARLGHGGDETSRVVRSVATALQLSGATAAEASSAMLQLSQSFNAGRLNGGEFNSIAENAPLILGALAVSMKRPIEELKKLGSEGKITGAELYKALSGAQAEGWDKAFAKLPITFAGAVQMMKNDWLRSMGEMTADVGFNKQLVEGVNVLRSLIPGITKELAKAFLMFTGWLNENKDGLIQIWDQVKGIFGDVWGIIQAFGVMAGSILGAGDGTNILAAAIFGVRLGVAAVQDGVLLLGAAFMGLGGVVAKYVVGPLQMIIGLLLGSIMEGFGKLIGGMASAAEAVGLKGLAGSLKSIGQASVDMGVNLKNAGDSTVRLGEEAIATAKNAVSHVLSQDGAVNRLLNSEKELLAVRTKSQGKFQNEKLGGGYKAPDEGAAKAAAKATKEFEEHVQRLNNALEKQLELSQSLDDFWKTESTKPTAATKERIALENRLHDLELKGASTFEKTRVRGLLLIAQTIEAEEKHYALRKEILEAEKAAVTKEVNKASALSQEADQLELKVQTYGMAKGAVEALEEAQTRQQLQELRMLPDLTEGQYKLIDALKEQLRARERLTNAGIKLGALDATKELEKLLNPRHAERFGESLSKAFGKAGKALGGLIDGFNKYGKRQTDIAKMRDQLNAKEKAGDKDVARYRQAIIDEELQATVGMYADMAGAAKGFLKEKTAGYRILEGLEKTFRAFEAAMELKSFLTKSGFIEAITGLKVAGDAEAAASAVQGAATEVAAAQTSNAAKATTAVLNQGGGDPYSAFFRMAAMAAIVAALGFAVGGGFNKTASAPKTNTGTGTVFGDSEAQSKSLANSIALLTDVDTMTMKYSAQMLASLRNIESSLAGVTNLVLRQAGVMTGDNFNVQQGVLGFNQGSPLLKGTVIGKILDDDPILGGLRSTLSRLWGKTKQEVEQAGVQMKGTLAQLSQGMGMQQFANVKVTQSSWFGLKKDTSYNTVTGALDPALAKQFGLIFNSFTDALKGAAGPLGVALLDIESRLQGFVLDMGQIDLKGLTGEQIQEKLAAVFGAAGDKIAQRAIPGLDAFQKVGEGYLETVVRVASGVEQADYELDKLGITAVGLANVLNKQGDVGGEITKMSIQFAEMTAGFGDGISQIVMSLSGTAAEIAETYASLKAAQRLMLNTGLGGNLNRDILKAAGGLEAFKDALTSYQDNFFSDAERQAMRLSNLQQDFGKLGLSMPTTKEAFRALVEQLNGQGNQSLAAKVLLLADAFSEWAQSVGGSSQAVQEARDNLSEAYEREKTALEETKSKFEDFAKSLKEFRTGLLTGELSPLSNTEKYGTLEATLTSTFQKAMAGDEDAISKYQGVAEQFLQFSQEFNASGAQYNTDFQRVLAETAALEQYTSGRASLAEQQLETLQKQVEGLITINESILTVAQAIDALNAALAAQNAPAVIPAVPVTVSSGTTSAIPTTPDRSQALAADELAAVRQELVAIREQNVQLTQALIAATVESNEANAEAIIQGGGSSDGARTSVYSPQWGEGF